MRQLDRYLAKLVKSQLYGEKADELPDGITVQEIVDIAKKKSNAMHIAFSTN